MSLEQKISQYIEKKQELIKVVALQKIMTYLRAYRPLTKYVELHRQLITRKNSRFTVLLVNF